MSGPSDSDEGNVNAEVDDTELERPFDAAEMLALVRDGYEALLRALARVPQDEWDRGAGGSWSPKEQLGHITFWETILLWRTDSSVEPAGPRDLPWGDVDGVNARVREWLGPQPVAEVRRRAAEVHDLVLGVVAAVDDGEMDNVRENLIGDESPWWRVVGVDTWDHYPEHVRMLEEAFP